MCETALKHVKPQCRKSIDEEYSMNTSIITKKRFLRYVKGYSQITNTPACPSPHQSWCPRVNMYYAFNEDTNPFTRINEFIESTCTCSYNVNTSPHFAPPLDPFTDRDPYSEDEARRKHLSTKPVCFIIFGKPGLNSRKLAKMIADSWNCVLISPEILLKYEIEMKTDKGQWIEQVLLAGRDIGPEVIMNLIECRINQRDVLHRGYIIEGLPLIPNNPDLDYSRYSEVLLGETEQNSNSSNPDTSTCGEDKEAEPKVRSEMQEEVNNEGEEEWPNEQNFDSMKYENHNFIANPFNSDSLKMTLRDSYERDIQRQIEDIFNTWPIKPQVIIYMMCPDQDVVSKRYQFKLNPYSGNIVDTGLLETKQELYTLFSHAMIEPDIDIPIELYQESMIEQRSVDRDFRKHLLRRVCDMRPNVEVQCNIYERYALPCIEKQVLKHNPQYVIRVDGRTAVSCMFQIVQVKLRTLPLPRVLLPKKMLNSIKEFQEGEESLVPENNFEGKTNKEIFQELATKGIVSSRFPWRISRWRFLCPVALAKGQIIEGNFKYAVCFMNQLFFLSSLETMEIFVQNPRTFLLPPNPRPTCKIAAFGPKYSGKSKLSYDLSNVFGITVIDIQSIENKLVNDHLQSNIVAAKRNILVELNKRLRIEREERETARLSGLQSWYMEVKNLVNQLMRILGESKRGENVSEEDSTVIDINELEVIRKKFREYNLEFIETDENVRKRINENDTMLLDFAPSHLQNEESPVRELTEYDPEFVTVLNDRMMYIRNASVNVTDEERAMALIETINLIPNESTGDGLIREGGWILDGMYTNPEVWTRIVKAGISVDDLIIIYDEAPYDYLIQKWYKCKFQQKIVNYEDEEEKREEDNNLYVDGVSEDIRDVEFEGEGMEIDIKTKAIENYINDVKQFESNWKNFQETFIEVKENVIACNLKMEDKFLESITKCMNNRYRLGASIMTDEEKEREVENSDGIETIEPDEGTLEDEENEDEVVKQKASKDNRRLGETGPYCPVALSRHNVLWKGKEQFSAWFLDKIYLLSSEKALEIFIRDPYEFIIYNKPLKVIPPLRICIVGPPGSGKTTLARALSKEHGLVHVDFLSCLEMYMKDRGIPLVGLKHEDMFSFDTNDPLNDVSKKMELPEDLENHRYNIDKTSIQTSVREYLKEGTMLPKEILKECLLNYFRAPYNECGIILDSFPNCVYDVEVALDNFAIPEVVIQLQCNCDKILERMVLINFHSWSMRQDEKKLQEEERYDEECEIFMEKKKHWIKKKLKERRQRHINQSIFEEIVDVKEDNEEIEGVGLSRQTLISEKSTDFEFEDQDEEQAMIDQMELEDLWQKEFPEPIKFEDWEDPEVAKENISRELELAYEVNSKNLLLVRTAMENESIIWIEINAEEKESLIFLSVLKILDPFIFRNSSVLELTNEVDMETAERLLDCGYYFLSSFGRYCPVQLYENKIPFQMFLPLEVVRQVYPVLHRQYVYFIAGSERLSVFLKHPLKYLEQDSCAPLIPAYISIIGPPKCGKSTLAKRFAKTYGMKVITRGQSLRHLLKNFSWTELSQLTETHLRGGHACPGESIARAVEMFCIDPRSASQGYVLDGFPASQAEVEELAFLGIRPMIVIHLKADLNFCLECLASEADYLKKPSRFSPCYLSYQYENWQAEERTFRNWLTKFAQNVVELDGTARKWAVWVRANKEVCFRFARIKKYFREADYDKVHSLAYMCVSPYEFKQRQSQFESFCPVCLREEGSMNFSGPPPDHQGIVQFREYYYWICPQHIESFYKEPLEYLPPLNPATLPEDRPRMIEETIDVDHACWAKRLRVDGFCLVTFVDNFPKRKLIRGRSDLGILHEDQLYLFCSENCRSKFLRQYSRYSKFEINLRKTLPPVEVKTLPNLGFLEQTVATLIVRAVNKIGVLRPKLPGMTPQITAAIYIGAYLKVHHRFCTLNEIAVYENVTKRIEARSQIIDVAIRNIKKRINPFVTLLMEPEIKHEFEKKELISPIVRANSVKFRRTSPTQNFLTEDDTDRWSTSSYSIVN